jgi:hypothetical protein
VLDAVGTQRTLQTSLAAASSAASMQSGCLWKVLAQARVVISDWKADYNPAIYRIAQVAGSLLGTALAEATAHLLGCRFRWAAIT